MSESGDDGAHWLALLVEKVFGKRARALLERPVLATITIIATFFFDRFIFPIFVSILAAGAALIDAIVYLFLGADGKLSSRGSIGVADMPLFGSRVFIEALDGPVADVIGIIAAFNAEMTAIAARAGIGGFPVAATIVAVETVIIAAVLWAVLAKVAELLIARFFPGSSEMLEVLERFL